MRTASITDALPPAYPRNDLSMYMRSCAVAKAVVIKSKRWSKEDVTRHLVAKYKVLDVFKGDMISILLSKSK